MPPLIKYMFKHKITSSIVIILEIHGDEKSAWKKLTNFVINTNDWYL